jgi:hypothetical protein
LSQPLSTIFREESAGFFVSQIVIREEPSLSDSRLRLSYIGWQAVVGRILGFSVAEPEKGILIIRVFSLNRAWRTLTRNNTRILMSSSTIAMAPACDPLA